ncbi:RNA-binding protein S4 [Stenotrophomonas terrae]|uniref:Dual-specificity RNA pseudouridine synthase RluF n=1 Tax=Stenotrophomonas terrae TaxID=405446 RepID=A0A0R0CSB6_9GAMM|nr:rRNA pseudouridine synthase [Stenotrophomonas terrae]KRG72166.1 RNA-binding protein S4 [Stenotrophomonas terrae]
MTTPIRLDKRVAAQLQCSRSQAQQYIEGGWISVNGVVVETPQTMVTEEVITLGSEGSTEAAEAATFLINKPAGCSGDQLVALLSDDNRFADDASGIRPLSRHFQRLDYLMPLDDAASGLVVLTQDWRVRRHLLESGSSLEQEYVVEVSGEPSPWAMPKLTHGLIYEGRGLPQAKISWQSEQRLRFAIKDVRLGQLQNMCNQVGLKAEQIRRLRIGRIGLSKMPEGQWRYLAANQKF